MSSCTARTPSAGGNPTIADPELTPADRAALLGLARATLEAHLEDRPLPPAGSVPGAALKRGAVVTLTERGALRGCIGHIAADREPGAGGAGVGGGEPGTEVFPFQADGFGKDR